MIKFLEKDNFKEEINSDFVLVDFHADWCGPCRMLGRVLEQLEDVNILKVNVDEHKDLVKEYKILSIPCIMIFKKEKFVSKQIGFMDKEDLEKWIKENKD